MIKYIFPVLLLLFFLLSVIHKLGEASCDYKWPMAEHSWSLWSGCWVKMTDGIWFKDERLFWGP